MTFLSGFNPIFLAQVDLFSKSLLLVPIHLEVHWCLVTADIVKKKICLYDSQGNALQKVARVISSIFFFVSLTYSLYLNVSVAFPAVSSLSNFKTIFLYALHMIEHPEILDDGSKREEANRFFKWMGRVIQ